MSTARAHGGAVAAHGLPGAPPIPAAPIDAAGWAALSRVLVTERITPIASYAVADGAFATTDAQAAELREAHERAMSLALVLDRRLLGAGDLGAAGIDVRALKGPAVARLDYPDPSWRGYGDVDLLVPGASFDEAGRILIEHGATRRFAEVRPGFDARFGKAVTFVDEGGIQVDLHRTFATGPFGLRIDLDALYADREVVEVGGRSVATLGRRHRFLHACFHAALGDQVPRLLALRDVAQLVLATDLDLDAARAEARTWGAEAVVARALALAWADLGLAPHPVADWAGAYTPSARDARALAAYTSSDRSYASQVAAGVSAVPGFTGKLAYVRALLLPDRRHIAGRDGTYRARVRRALAARRVSRDGAA
ncbi:MAG: nucleotidyltransferase family protein [Actinomycetes bacterium]